MQNRNGRVDAGGLSLPPTPRPTRLSAAGAILAVACVAAIAGSIWVALSLMPHSTWPAYLVPPAAFVGSSLAFALLQHQRRLLTEGRPAMATITRIDKKQSDKGTYWRVEYQWTLLNGATRTAHYNHHRRQPPAPGTRLPIIYDRDNPTRQRRYPFPLVSLHRNAES